MRQKAFHLIQSHLKEVLIALICSLAVVFYVCFDQVALSTDDSVQVNLIASGALGPHSQYLIYMNIVYGWFLKVLYLLIPSVNWYLFCGLFFNLCAVISVCVLVCRSMRLLPALSVTLLCLFFFSKDFFLSTHYTSNVFLYAAAGYFWLLYAILQKKKKAVVPACLFLALSACSRAAAFLMTVPFFAAVLFVALLFHKNILRENKKVLLKEALLFTLPFLAAALLFALDTFAYAKDPAWTYFNNRVKALVEIQDRGLMDYLNHKELYDAAGFPMATVNLVTNWLDNDPEVYSLEQLRKMSDIKRSYNPISFRVDIETLYQTYVTVRERLLSFSYCLPWAFVAGAVLFLLRKDKKRLALVLLNGLLTGGIYYALTCYGRLGWHVEIGIWMMAFMLPFAYLFAESPAAARDASYGVTEKRLYLACAGLLSAAALLLCLAVVRDPKGNRLIKEPPTTEEQAWANEVLTYACSHKEDFYIVASAMGRGYWGAANVYDLNRAHSEDFVNLCWLGGWFAGSPIGNYRAHAAGFTNPVRALFERPETFLIATENEVEWVYYFMLENYRPDLLYQQVDTVAGYGVWKFYAA